MSFSKLLSESGKGFDGIQVNRESFYGMNPFESGGKFATPYQFPPSSSGSNPFMYNDGAMGDNNHGFGLKYGGGTGFGHAAVETQSHYGPPQMHSKGGKLKGAALSALTLLAFLFFLNLLQSCLQMDVMNPTVMVMSAGQRTYVLKRNDEFNDPIKQEDDDEYDDSFPELEIHANEGQSHSDINNYKSYTQISDNSEKSSTAIRPKNKIKRRKPSAYQ